MLIFGDFNADIYNPRASGSKETILTNFITTHNLVELGRSTKHMCTYQHNGQSHIDLFLVPEKDAAAWSDKPIFMPAECYQNTSPTSLL